MPMNDAYEHIRVHFFEDLNNSPVRHIPFSLLLNGNDEMIITFLDDLFRALTRFDSDFDIHARLLMQKTALSLVGS